jgi:hypothetical protein
MSEKTYENDWDCGRVATQCEVSDRPLHSKLLGPDGNPLPYKHPPKIGFDLTPRGSK